MSAFLCEAYHVGRCAAYIEAVYRTDDDWLRRLFPETMAMLNDETDPIARTCWDTGQVVAVTFAKANLASVDARYGESKHINGAEGFLGGLAPDEYILECVEASRKPWLEHVQSDAAMFRALGCLDYQSCEVEGWRETEAARLIDCARMKAGDRMAGTMLGDERVWELKRPTHEPKVVSVLSMVKEAQHAAKA